MNYSQAEKYLNSFIDYEVIPGISYAQPDYDLRHVEELLKEMGNPHLEARAIHIAGTKGKGSVAAMIAQVLTCSGYRTGLYTSPHLHNLRERIRVDGGLISPTEFATAMAEVKPFIETMKRSAVFRQPTFFEVLTVLAFAYFRKKQLDFQVLEVGLGGRLDATNVVRPEISIITPVSIDHIEVLGASLEKIAYEKAGIIKPGCWVVLSPQPEGAKEVILNVCREQGAKVIQVGQDVTWYRTGGDLIHQSLEIQGRLNNYPISIPLLGDHQLENAAIAVSALEILASAGFAILPAGIAEGLARVEWPGRFQILQHEPVVLVDGAHNVASMKRLVGNIKAYFSYRRIFLIIGVSCDKDIPGIIEELVPLSPQVIVTYTSHSRAASPETVADEFARQGIKSEIGGSVAQTLERALSMADKTDIICVTGSLFVVAEALDYVSSG